MLSNSNNEKKMMCDDDDDVCMKIVDIIKKALIARFYINVEE
jgi:hypothetical protein